MNSQPTSLAPGRQEARRLVAVEADVAVGEVVDHDEAVLLGQVDDLLEERLLDDRGRRVVRVVEDQDLGPGVQALADPGDVGQERLRVADVERDHVGRGQRDGVDVDREARAPGTSAVSPGPSRARHMWLKPSFEPIVATTSWSGSRLTPNRRLVPHGDLAAQVVHAVGHAVAVVPRVAGRLAELVDDPLLGRVGRVAHAQVDDVDPRLPLAVLQLVDPAEQVGRQVAHPGRDLEVVVLDRLMLLRARIGLGIDHRQLRPRPVTRISSHQRSIDTGARTAVLAPVSSDLTDCRQVRRHFAAERRELANSIGTARSAQPLSP